tara:strand:- start:12171 stop:12401 length:231 start_codon:yes stop_codon:yes gene_type:complete
MSSERRRIAYEALHNHFEAQASEGLHNLLVYFENPAGIGEHPELQEEMRSQLEKVANAEDVLGCLKRHSKLLRGTE